MFRGRSAMKGLFLQRICPRTSDGHLRTSDDFSDESVNDKS
jgi:hypothetical protein